MRSGSLRPLLCSYGLISRRRPALCLPLHRLAQYTCPEAGHRMASIGASLAVGGAVPGARGSQGRGTALRSSQHVASAALASRSKLVAERPQARILIVRGRRPFPCRAAPATPPITTGKTNTRPRRGTLRSSPRLCEPGPNAQLRPDLPQAHLTVEWHRQAE